jgi:hypothetical protein
MGGDTLTVKVTGIDKDKGYLICTRNDSGYNPLCFIDPFVGCAVPFDEFLSFDDMLGRYIGKTLDLGDNPQIFQPTYLISKIVEVS